MLVRAYVEYILGVQYRAGDGGDGDNDDGDGEGGDGDGGCKFPCGGKKNGEE